MTGDDRAPDRRTALGTVAAGALVSAVLSGWLVPWDPVPGGDLAAADPTRYFTATQLDRADDYAAWARVWSWSSLAVSLIVACGLGFSRLGPALVRRLPGPWWVQAPLAVAALSLIGRLVTLPFGLTLWDRRVEEGLSTQSLTGFLEDVAKNQVVSIVLTSLAILVLLGCARRWQRAWPAVVGGLLATLVAVGSFVYPVVIEPLFNSFEPLPEGQLRAEIFDLADREGVELDDVLVADASRRTTSLNAYVSGFGDTRRVVVYDNLVDSLGQDEALSVVAHELAHAKYRDVVVGTVLGAAGSLIGVGLLALVVAGLTRRRDLRIGDPAAVPLVLALVAVATVVTMPVQNGISRQIETRADVVALETTEDPEAFIELQRQLTLRSLGDATPLALSQWWFGSHPPVQMRIALAERFADDR